MDTINLKLSTSQNRALNQDGVTLLRSISFIQGETYTVNLAFLDESTPVTPSMGAFSFYLRTVAGVNIAAANSVTSQAGDYPFYFTISLDSPSLSNALGSAAYVDMQGVISYEDSGEVEVIQPFTIRVFTTQASGSQASYVSSINGLSSDVTFSGSGSVSVSQSGQAITIFGSAPSGDYYPNSNPSGYITTEALAPYALQSDLNASGSGLAASVAALAAQTGSYYPDSNPNGFIDSSALAPYATTGNLSETGSNLQGQINTLTSQTGDYYLNTNPSSFATQTYVNTQIAADDLKYLPSRLMQGTVLVNGCFSSSQSPLPDLTLEDVPYAAFYPTKIVFVFTDIVPTTDVTITIGDPSGGVVIWSAIFSSGGFTGYENNTLVIDPFTGGYFRDVAESPGYPFGGGSLTNMYLKVSVGGDTTFLNPFHTFISHIEGFYGPGYNLISSSVIQGGCFVDSGGSSGGGGGF